MSRLLRAITPMMLYTKVTMHTVGHFPMNNSDRPIAMPATSIIRPQNTPRFHAKLVLFLSPQAQNNPKMPNKISSQNGLTIKKFIPALLPSSKFPQVKVEPGYSIEISNVISGKAIKKAEFKNITIDKVTIMSQIYFARPFSSTIAFTWTCFLSFGCARLDLVQFRFADSEVIADDVTTLSEIP